MICERCGQTLTVGEWPFCPHGAYRGDIVRDEIPGGFVQHNFGHQPETFYSWSAMRKRADALGLQPFVKKLETVQETAAIDAKTLENAAVLVSRGVASPSGDDLEWQSFESSTRFGTLTELTK